MEVLKLVEDQPFDRDKQRLVTLDGASLYTSIPQKEALEVVREVLEHREWPHWIPTEFIVSLLEVAMTKNFFIFKNNFFYQTKGVAIGAGFAPDIAKLFTDTC